MPWRCWFPESVTLHPWVFPALKLSAPRTWISFLRLPCQGNTEMTSAKMTFLPIFILIHRGSRLRSQRKLMFGHEGVWWSFPSMSFSLNMTRWRWVVFLKCLSPTFWLCFTWLLSPKQDYRFHEDSFPPSTYLQHNNNVVFFFFLVKRIKKIFWSMLCYVFRVLKYGLKCSTSDCQLSLCYGWM